MKVNILAFGVAKDIFGDSNIGLDLPNDSSVYNLKYSLEKAISTFKATGFVHGGCE